MVAAWIWRLYKVYFLVLCDN